MACNHLSTVTCTRCHEEFVVRIEAETPREFLKKYRNYTCPRCRKSLPAPATEEPLECAA